ncbi:hypothetical protein PAN31108_03979 [Pandoraea anhela]|uniref:Uncharacterized protein n=1 Tax=Pandoraea anhela TaxID=2508295 RepID=A0A5E4XNH5_9BURK|nr:hypothetical protein PAN31108_03979 [Pandoraea anhela]
MTPGTDSETVKPAAKPWPAGRRPGLYPLCNKA